MKRFTLLTLILVLSVGSAVAGGILTNTNQSATYVRLLANDASIGIDAVYYNPAGLSFLSDGFHLSINNQSIFQDQEIINSYNVLNHDTYLGDIKAPLFPGIYAAYKVGKFAFSFGFNPIGGGGGAEFKEGLPSFETNMAELPLMLAPLGYDNAYSGDFYFTGTSVIWGLQFGVTYQTCDYFSLYAGGRYLMAKNTYEGHIKDLNLYYASTPVPAKDAINGVATSFAGAATSLQGFIDLELGGLALNDPVVQAFMTAEEYDDLHAGLTALGLPEETPVQAGQNAFAIAGAQYGAQASLLEDQEAEAEETGSGFAPIFGANISLLDKRLNIGIKYELAAELELEYNTTKDFNIGFNEDGSYQTQFPHGAKTRSDMPAMLSVGASYQVSEKCTVHGGYHLYWDSDVNWGGKEEFIEDNYFEAAVGLEYKVADNLWLSAGYLFAGSGVTDEYQSDMSYSLSSNTLAFGGKFKVQDNFYVNMGVLYTGYQTGTVYHDEYNLDTNVKETLAKDNIIFAIGADVKIF